MGLRVPLHALFHLIFLQPLSIPLRPLFTLDCSDVPHVHDLPRNKNVAPGSPWVSKVDLLQYTHGSPDMYVWEVYPHCHPLYHPPPTPLNWEFLREPHLGNPYYMYVALCQEPGSPTVIHRSYAASDWVPAA